MQCKGKIMGLLDSLTEIATGGLGKSIVDVVTKYFPPNMSDVEKENVRLAAANLELQRAREFAEAQTKAEDSLNARIAMYEGSSADLKGIPFLGPLLIMLRGLQRPVWGFAALYFDYGVFSGMWKLADNTVSNAFWIVNLLVLGFLFGERAIMNVMPFFTQLAQAKQGQQITPIVTASK